MSDKLQMLSLTSMQTGNTTNSSHWSSNKQNTMALVKINAAFPSALCDKYQPRSTEPTNSARRTSHFVCYRPLICTDISFSLLFLSHILLCWMLVLCSVPRHSDFITCWCGLIVELFHPLNTRVRVAKATKWTYYPRAVYMDAAPFWVSYYTIRHFQYSTMAMWRCAFKSLSVWYIWLMFVLLL